MEKMEEMGDEMMGGGWDGILTFRVFPLRLNLSGNTVMDTHRSMCPLLFYTTP